jgi:hypothetical protein
MLAGTYNMLTEQGSTMYRVISLEYPDLANDPSGETYLPWDLNGYTARMQVRRLIEDAAYMIEITTENGGIVVESLGSADKGRIDLLMTATQTAALDSNGVYDLEIIDTGATGTVSKVIKGTFTLIPEVTR